jgi:hypothetical protein
VSLIVDDGSRKRPDSADVSGNHVGYRRIHVQLPRHGLRPDLSVSDQSIGYEDHDCTTGVQISYEEIPSSGTSYWVAPACTAALADNGRRLEAMEEVSRRRGLGSAGLRAPPSNALIGSRAKSERQILNRFGDDNPKKDKMYGTNYVQQQQQQQQQQQ